MKGKAFIKKILKNKNWGKTFTPMLYYTEESRAFSRTFLDID